jgi:hypothetical protein
MVTFAPLQQERGQRNRAENTEGQTGGKPKTLRASVFEFPELQR